MSARMIACVLVVATITCGGRALADDDTPTPAAEDDATARARDAFKEGAGLVEQSEWSRALAAFERSLAAREHALTIFNMGVCQRFLGRATLARQTLRAALRRNEHTSEMPDLFVEQAKTYLAEIDRKLVRVVVTVRPRAAAIAVEGRPLVPAPDAPGTWIAGIAPGGVGRSAGADRFEVLVDPGTAVFAFTLEGHDAIELREELKPGSVVDLPVSMTEQAAQVRVSADRPHAIVRVDEVDIGLAPVVVKRPPGSYRLSVSKPGFVTYESKLSLRPGQSLQLDATLREQPTPLTKKWWFWAASGAVLAGATVTTFFLVRPEPTRPDVNRGGLGWAAEVP